MSEAELLRQIQVAVAPRGVRLFRNNVGRLQDKRGEWVAYGLCVGSSDLIGWKPITITPEMVGKRVAVFLALEVKTQRGALTLEQFRFLEAVKVAGGIGFLARSVGDAVNALSM